MTTTDDGGWFHFRAPTQPELHPWALSRHARLEPKVPGERWSAGRVRVYVAHPVLRLSIALRPWFRLEGAATSDPVPRQDAIALSWTIRVDGKQVTTTTMGSPPPFVVADWKPPETGVIEVEVISEAHGFARFARRWTLSREELAPVLQVTLRPLPPEEVGTVLVEGPPAPAMGSAAGVVIQRQVDMGAPGRMNVAVFPQDPATPDRVRLPAGRLRLVGRPDTSLGFLLSTSEDVDVVAGQETVWRPRWPPHGSLKIETRSTSSGWRIHTLRLEGPGGEEQQASLSVEDAEVLVPYLPPGTWRIRAEGVEPTSVEIRAGQVASLVLGR